MRAASGQCTWGGSRGRGRANGSDPRSVFAILCGERGTPLAGRGHLGAGNMSSEAGFDAGGPLVVG